MRWGLHVLSHFLGHVSLYSVALASKNGLGITCPSALSNPCLQFLRLQPRRGPRLSAVRLSGNGGRHPSRRRLQKLRKKVGAGGVGWGRKGRRGGGGIAACALLGAPEQGGRGFISYLTRRTPRGRQMTESALQACLKLMSAPRAIRGGSNR